MRAAEGQTQSQTVGRSEATGRWEPTWPLFQAFKHSSLIKKIYLCFVILVLIIAIVLSYINLYLAIPFYGIETIFLGYALYITALKSTFYEKITISPTEIEISFVEGKKINTIKFVKEWAKFYFTPPTNLKHSEIYISRSGKKTFIGRKVNEENRKELFDLLKKLS